MEADGTQILGRVGMAARDVLDRGKVVNNIDVAQIQARRPRRRSIQVRWLGGRCARRRVDDQGG